MPVASSDFPERFARTVGLYGPERFARIRAARAVVVGAGGVGSHAAVALARSGIGALTLIDPDVITPSSLNRHPCAGPGDVGRPKTEVLARFLSRTCPDTAVRPVSAFFHTGTAAELLDERPDLLVDAIDGLGPKVALLAWCLRREWPVVSSMGAAGHTDVSAVRSGDLWASRRCPLARRVRRLLRREGLVRPLPCVWSEEAPAVPLDDPGEEPAFQRGRPRRPLPSGMALPGIFGYAVASLGLELIAG